MAANVPGQDGSMVPFEESKDAWTSSEQQQQQQQQQPRAQIPMWAQIGFATLNVGCACAAMSVVKQMFLPSAVQPPADLQKAPAWYTAKYGKSYLVRQAIRNTLKDTASLMGSCAVWFGVQSSLARLRGTDDFWNHSIAGTVSGGMLGSTFFGPSSRTRVAIFAAAGAVVGYYTHHEAQVLRQRLLKEQQRLEQKYEHHTQVKQVLDPEFLRQLLKKEEQASLDQVKTHLEALKITKPHGHPEQKGELGQSTQSNEWGDVLASAPWPSEKAETSEQ